MVYFFSSIGGLWLLKTDQSSKNLYDRVEKSSDEFRASSTEKRHSKHYRTARENLNHLVDEESFLEFGQFAVAAQRSRRDYEELQDKTNADGIITGFCSVNSEVGRSQRSMLRL